MTRLEKLRLWVRVTWWDVRDWCLRWVYAQHNARVLVDLEGRMMDVIHAATGNMMSKAYYELDVMLEYIERHHSRLYDEGYDEGYAEGRADLAEEAGITDPSPVVLE